ncbi:opt family small oligopeptide transporter [Stemphylium lycopersici]|nr:opt family small oligopeptide transporter [Stemphylium lycopersici]RAR08987.1 opt family small oligopeptide transporter [Stemphylium lycopersici]
MPNWGLAVFGHRICLNPGPFNYKENILIYILANLSFMTRLSADVLTEQRFFYGFNAGWGFELCITLSTIIFGFGLSGIFRSIVVEPAGFVWPGVLGNTALNHALFSRKPADSSESGSRQTMSRYRFFIIAFCVSFCWYWLPDFLFPALGYFTFVCWAAPSNVVVNQVFGMKSGMGLLPLTFDWSQIAYIGSPLVVPTWTILNVLAALVFWIYIVSPIIYYTNTWYTGYMPFQSNTVYDNMGTEYNVSRIIDKSNGFVFDHTKYQEYSEIYLPVTYGLNTFGLCFASIAALFVWLFLEKRHQIMNIARSSPFVAILGTSKMARKSPQPHYEDVPVWWYITTSLVGVSLGVFACEYYPVQLRWYGALFAFGISTLFFVPLAWVYATSNVKIQIDMICRIIAGYLYEGKVLANIWFFNLGYISGVKGLAFAQDLKLGIYCNIPPRKLFAAQLTGLIIGSLTQVSVVNWALTHIPHICTADAVNGFTCPFSRTHFNTSLIWGAVGPRRFFAKSALYHPLLYFFLLGALLPLAIYTLRKYLFPRSKWLAKAHAPLLLGGLNYIPPASGTNYGSWALVGLGVGLWVKKRDRGWWTRYNFVLSAALDCAVAVAGVLIFFTVFYSGAAEGLDWWGTRVYKDTCDWRKCSWKAVAEGEKFGP